ncbi:MAG: AAA family ATPase, partial [Planctomycetales bacterium]|nr:AAA family ATPase [Planctomycetales bacterium]
MASPEAQRPEGLAKRILSALEAQPGQRGSDLASRLGVDRKEVNRCLAHELAGRVVQDSGYRWSLRHGSGVQTPVAQTAGTSLTELARLCRYYLECIGNDTGEGVSVFAASKFGEPEYTELPALPVLDPTDAWWNSPGVQRVLGNVRADRGNLVAWLGYPVRLREHRTAKWRGFFVEPVMLWAIELPEQPGDLPRIVDDLPVPNFSVLRSMAMGDASAVVEEAARLDEELGLNSPLEDRPEIDELLERLVAIRPDWDWQEALTPENCAGDQPLAGIGKAGIYNRAVILPGKRSPYTQGLESELKQLAEIPDVRLAETALGKWLSGATGGPVQGDTQPLIEVVPMNSEQRAAVESALTAPHTVVTGPPGTGKSQVVTNLLVNAAWRGMKVLFASKNNKAVDVVEARVNGLGNRPVLLRLGNKEYQAKLATYLTSMLSGRVGEDDRISYEEGLAHHTQLARQLKELDALQARTLEARNRVDKLEADVEALRKVFGPDRFNALDASLVAKLPALVEAAETKADALDP